MTHVIFIELLLAVSPVVAPHDATVSAAPAAAMPARTARRLIVAPGLVRRMMP